MDFSEMKLPKIKTWQKFILLIINQIIHGVLYWMIVPIVFNMSNVQLKILLGICVAIGLILPNSIVSEKLSSDNELIKFISNFTWLATLSYLWFQYGSFTSYI